jgi:hypothetical protein
MFCLENQYTSEHSFGSEPMKSLGVLPGSTPSLSDSPSAHLIFLLK